MTHVSDLLLVANAGDGTISALRLHREPEPHLEVLATSADLPGCSTFAVDTGRDLVHAAFKGDPPGIATLALDRATGILTELSRSPVEGSLSYLSLTPDGSSLLGASYGAGFGAVWPVRGNGLGEPHSRFTHRNLHCIVVDEGDADGAAHTPLRVYAASLGDDLIAQFAMDPTGALAPLDPPTVAAPPGSGPRHLVVERCNDRASVYLVTEFSGEVIRYPVAADGALRPAESIGVVDPDAALSHSRFGADPVAEHLIWGADVHRAGPYLVTSERTSSHLAVTALGRAGELDHVVGFTPTEHTPRGFAASPDGRFVVAVGEGSTHAQLLEVGGAGVLTPRDRVQIGAGANWVRFVAQPTSLA